MKTLNRHHSVLAPHHKMLSGKLLTGLTRQTSAVAPLHIETEEKLDSEEAREIHESVKKLVDLETEKARQV
jgi:hypothetical protein